MARGRKYTEQDRIAALAMLEGNGGNVKKTSSMLDIPPKTLRDWRKGGKEAPPEKLDLIAEAKEGLAERCEKLAGLLLGDLEDESERAEATFKEKATAFGIIVDKMRLLRGEPTAIVQGLEDDRRRRLRERYGANRQSDAPGTAGTDPGGQPVRPPGADGGATPVP